MTAKQIPLSFPVQESYTRDSFMIGECNAEAMQWIDRWPDWPVHALIIHGPAGCGKTHLLNIWQEQAMENGLAIDNAERIFGNKEAEHELFHAYNQAREDNNFIMIAMAAPPAQQDIHLPDLASRLRASPQVAVEAPDDITLQAVMVKLMHDRQMKITPEVISYILPRIERSFAAIGTLVEQLDTTSMSEKRAITIPLVKSILLS